MTYCVAVEANLLVAVCPLRVGACMWQHRTTHHCKYTEQEISPEEFAALVNAPTYDHEKVRKQIALEVQRD